MADPSFDPADLPTKRVGAGALIRNGMGHVLLVEPTYKPMWEIPGGLVEPDESPREAAARECLEELDATIEIGRLLCVHYAPSSRMPGDGVMFVFDGGTTQRSAASFELPPEELASAAFVDPAELAAYLPDTMVRRMRAAIEAEAGRTTNYLER